MDLGDLLLEQDGTETCVESTDTLVLQHLAEASNEAIGVGWLGDETNTGGLERAEGDISEELSESGGSQVDSCAVVGGSLVSEKVDGLLLEEFVTSKLECALEEVSGGGRTETSQQSTGTLLCDDLTETTNETLVICDGIELYSCLDAVKMRCQSDISLSRPGVVGDKYR